MQRPTAGNHDRTGSFGGTFDDTAIDILPKARIAKRTDPGGSSANKPGCVLEVNMGINEAGNGYGCV